MKQLHIVGVGGSMNPNSQNLRALRYVMHFISQTDVKTTLINVRDLDLPMYDDSRDLASYSAHIQDYIATIQNADGIIWSTSAITGRLQVSVKMRLTICNIWMVVVIWMVRQSGFWQLPGERLLQAML